MPAAHVRLRQRQRRHHITCRTTLFMPYGDARMLHFEMIRATCASDMLMRLFIIAVTIRRYYAIIIRHAYYAILHLATTPLLMPFTIVTNTPSSRLRHYS